MVLIEYVLVAVVCLVVGTILAFLSRDTVYKRQIDSQNEYIEQLETEVKSWRMTEKQQRGQLVREKNSERTDAAMMEFAQAVQAGQKPEEIIKALIPKYPDVAMRLAKKGLKI